MAGGLGPAPVGRIKVIFFDAAGTLFHVKGSVGEVYLSYAEKYGVPPTPETAAAVNAAFRRAFQDAPPPVFAATDPVELKRCERLWWFDLVHAVFYRVGLFEGFDDYFEEVFEGFGEARHWAAYPEAAAVLGSLKSSGFELGIISNFDTRLFNILRGLDLARLFDTVTISSLAKAAKPAPRIFQAALDEHAVDPDEALHVGDSLVEDVEGANQAKLIGVWLNRDEGEATGESFRGYRIESLRELPRLLDTLGS